MVSKKDEEKLEKRIQKLQEDTSFDWARKPTVMRFLAYFTGLAAAVTPLAFLAGSIPGVAAAAVMFAGYFVLRAATRAVAELPDRYLDERELAVRNSTYVKAYQSLAGMVGIVAVFVFVSAMFADASGRPIEIVFEYDQIQALVWLFLGPITVIPTVSLALRTPGRKGNK